MTIETKYQSGNKVWFMLGNKAVEKQILQMIIEESPKTWEKGSDVKIKYKIETSGFNNTNYIEEKLLFPTKQELLNSL